MTQQCITSKRELSLSEEEIKLVTEFASKMKPGVIEWRPIYDPVNIKRIYGNFK